MLTCSPATIVWMLRNLGLMGAPLAAGSLSTIGLSALRYTTGIAAFMQQQNYASGRNHGKSSTRGWISFPVQHKTGRTMTPVDCQHNNVQGYATTGLRPRHTETNISGWTIDTIKKVRIARSFCSNRVLQQARLTCSINISGKAIQVYGHWARSHPQAMILLAA